MASSVREWQVRSSEPRECSAPSQTALSRAVMAATGGGANAMSHEGPSEQVQATAANREAGKSDRIGRLSGQGSRRSLPMRFAGAIVLIMLAATGPAAAQTLASGAEIRGQVVDNETGQPLE